MVTTNESPLNVLLIENDSLTSIKLKEHLAKHDRKFEFNHVRDGGEALDYLKNRPPFQNVPRPKLIILNVNLPTIDGYQVIQVIKESAGLKDIPIIIIGEETRGEKKEKWVHSANAQDFTSTVESVRHFLLGALKGKPKSE